MQRKQIDTVSSLAFCPIARSLDRVGDQWSMLILRDAFYGMTRFDEFQKSLGIATNMLTRRLSTLVADGLLERRQYCEHPPRFEYVLTPPGRDFRPVLLTLLAWGRTHFSPEGATLQLIDQTTGAIADPVLVDRHTGKPIGPDHVTVAGPAASEGLKRRLAARPPKPASDA